MREGKPRTFRVSKHCMAPCLSLTLLGLKIQVFKNTRKIFKALWFEIVSYVVSKVSEYGVSRFPEHEKKKHLPYIR